MGTTKRLSAEAWIDFALTVLAREGAETLKADVLARKLKVSRGSFYWHFADLAVFHARVIARWRETMTEAVIASLARHGPPARRLDALLGRAFRHRNRLELRMRGWANQNAAAARAVRAVDRRRCRYIEALLREAGIRPAQAATRAQLLYWAYLGAALGRGPLAGGELKRSVRELMRIGLG